MFHFLIQFELLIVYIKLLRSNICTVSELGVCVELMLSVCASVYSLQTILSWTALTIKWIFADYIFVMPIIVIKTYESVFHI